MTIKKQLAIIGSGPAGFAAAIYAARASIDLVMIAGNEPGGQLMITTDVENYPGFADVIQGPWLMQQMQKQAENVGATIVNKLVSNVDFSNPQSGFVIELDDGMRYHAAAVIIATGAQAKWLGIPSETKYRGFGVSGCATCDGFFYKNKKVMVVGGGNTAVEEALFLTNFASEVILLHRRDKLRAEQIMQDRLFANPKIKPLWNSTLEEVLGDQVVTSARVKNVNTNLVETIEIDGVFIAIGHAPNTSLFKGKIKIDEEGYIVTHPGTTKTSMDGVFAAGDVQDKIYRQAVTAAGTGCMAALDAAKFLQDKKA